MFREKIRNFTEYPLGKTMSRFENITIREVESSDLETFYEHQLDAEAIRMAAFVGRDPKDKVAFDAHWDKILNSPTKHNEDDRGRGASRWTHRVLSGGRKHGSHLLASKRVLGQRISDSSAQKVAPPCCRLADLRQGSSGQHRVDKSARGMRF